MSAGDLARDGMEELLSKLDVRGALSAVGFPLTPFEEEHIYERWRALVAGEHGTAIVYAFGNVVQEVLGVKERQWQLRRAVDGVIDGADTEALDRLAGLISELEAARPMAPT